MQEAIRYNHWCKFRAVNNRIKKGSCLRLFANNNWKVDHQEVVDQVINEFNKRDGSTKFFGVILGRQERGKPSWQGKHVRAGKDCLYYELSGAALFPESLANTLDMRIDPTAIDVILGKYFSSKSGLYTFLPTMLIKLRM